MAAARGSAWAAPAGPAPAASSCSADHGLGLPSAARRLPPIRLTGPLAPLPPLPPLPAAIGSAVDAAIAGPAPPLLPACTTRGRLCMAPEAWAALGLRGFGAAAVLDVCADGRQLRVLGQAMPTPPLVLPAADDGDAAIDNVLLADTTVLVRPPPGPPANAPVLVGKYPLGSCAAATVAVCGLCDRGGNAAHQVLRDDEVLEGSDSSSSNNNNNSDGGGKEGEEGRNEGGEEEDAALPAETLLAAACRGLVVAAGCEVLLPARLFRQGGLPLPGEAEEGLLTGSADDTDSVEGSGIDVGDGRLLRLRVLDTTPASSPEAPVRLTHNTRLRLRTSAQPPLPWKGADDRGEDVVGAIGPALQALKELISYPLLHRELFEQLGLESPKGVLLHGPPGTGKTLLVQQAARSCRAHLVALQGSDVFAAFVGESEANLRRVFARARRLAERGPCVLFIDEIDVLCPQRRDCSTHEARVVAQLLTLLDGVEARGRLVVVGATNRPAALDPALRRPGRLDREVAIGVPDEAGREDILHRLTASLPLDTGSVSIPALARRTNGYVGADLSALCREAALGALRAHAAAGSKGAPPTVRAADFERALAVVVPSTQRDVHKPLSRDASWDDIGGLDDVKARLRQAIEWPMKYGGTMRRLGLPETRGVILHGPPGCGKTALVRTAAALSGCTFQAISGAQIYSAYVGEAEHAVRSAFAKARAGAPAILFIDEVDALVGKRDMGDGGSDGMQSQILSTMLNEMDGVESAGGVLVVAATNRLDMLDAAFLRPGRMDMHIHVPPPDEAGRRKILAVHLRNTPVAEDVDRERLVQASSGCSGAELESICREAALAALRDDLQAPAVAQRHFEHALRLVLAGEYIPS